MHKYDLYLRSVQEPKRTLDFIEDECRKRFKLKPKSFGEDFCGTFALSCAWVKRAKDRTAVAVDLSPVPIGYGKRHYAAALTDEQRKSLTVLQKDVRNRSLPKVDVLAAYNFSYLVFKKRGELLEYFKNCRRRLTDNGVLFLDLFGGSEMMHPNCDTVEFKKFTYYWDQVSFDPVTNEARFYIHFKEPRKKKMSRAFRYDWRMWTIPELRELLVEAGFQTTHVKKDNLSKTVWLADLSASVRKH